MYGVNRHGHATRWCDVCEVDCPANKAGWRQHINGERHQNNLRPRESSSNSNALYYYCHGSGKQQGVKADVQIAIQDTCADMVTFQESISGKSLARHLLDDDATKFEDVNSEGKMPAVASTKEEVTLAYFAPKRQSNGGGLRKTKECALFNASSIDKHSGGALFGHRIPSLDDEILVGGHPVEEDEGVFINTHEPFCLVTVGVQGAGKSHTTSCVLESCLVPFETCNIVKLSSPMISLVLHYDHNASSLCEAAGLISPSASFQAGLSHLDDSVIAAVPKSKAVILVSPTYYTQRKRFYGDYCAVKPLLFRWRNLGADHIKRIMRIESGDNQLYVAVFLDLLRGYQRKDVLPEFSAFLDQVRDKCSLKGQSGPLDQRIALLESVVAESAKNEALIDESLDLTACKDGDYHFIIADLTDPLLSKEEANGLFQVLTEQFRTLPTKGGKVLCLDEAHKYMSGEKADGLSEAIVNVARLMRHDGIRLVVSTQSPKALAPELLELVTVAVLHHFHSPDWWNYLTSKLPLNQDAFKRILSLGSGEAVVFATSHDLSVENLEGSHCLPIRIRPRLTEDYGSSRKNL